MKNSALIAAFVAATLPTLAHAHFLWATLDPATKAVSIGLQEFPGVEPASLKDHVPHVKAWSKGKKAIKLTPEGVQLKGSASEDSVGVSLNYGVLDKTQEGRGIFWLNYYAKAALTPEASQTKFGLPVELTVVVNGEGKPVVTVLHNGKPAADSTVVAQLPGEENPFQGKTGADGTIVLPNITGSLAVRALITENVKGTEGGKSFDLRRSYGSLSVNSLSGRAMTMVSDAKAYGLLERASKMRQTMPTDVQEVTGTVEFLQGGKSVKAPFVFKPGSKATIDKSGIDAAAGDAVEAQVSSLFNHRQRVPFAEGNGKYPLKIISEDENGTVVSVGDGQDSTMRVKNDELVEVNRTMHGNRFTISTLENIRTSQGRSLPKIYTVSYFDPKTGTLTKAQFFIDSYTEVNGVWLPLNREIRTAQEGKIDTVQLRFSNLKVARSK